MLYSNIMDFTKTSLKDLIKIVRLNKKTKEVMEALGLKDIRYAKKKPLLEYMNTHVENFQILEAEVEPEQEQEPETDVQPEQEYDPNDNQYVDDNSYHCNDNEAELVQKERSNVVQLDLSSIKTKRKQKQAPISIPVYESPEEIEEKNNALVTIDKYYNKFKWLHEENIDLSNPVRALKIVENKVSTKNTSALFSQNFFSLCSGAETLITKTPIVGNYIKIQGFTQNLKANEAAQDVIDELIIKYAPTIAGDNGLSVEARFGLIILGVMYQTHQMNTISEQVKNITNKPVTRKFDI